MSLALSGSAFGQNSVKSLKKERTTATKAIKETKSQIKDTKRETNRQLKLLDRLRADIDASTQSIAKVRSGVDSLNHSIAGVNASIALHEEKIRRLQTAYVKALRQMQKTTSNASVLSFILSSESFTQARRRISYLRQYAAWRRRKAVELTAARNELDSKRETLRSLQGQKASALTMLDRQNKVLEKQKNETTRVVAQLKQKQGELNQQLAKQQAQLRKLDAQIDNLIAKEQQQRAAAEKARRNKQKKDSQQRGNKSNSSRTQPPVSSEPKTADPDRALTGSFEQNKGSLLFPVAGRYSIARGFGRQPHPELPHVTTENSGIDLTVSPGTKARAVFNGKVSAIFAQDGFNSIVMVRHGAYITIYAGLTGLTVRNGQEVKTGQTLGTVADGTLHFELRHERTKLNPLTWVR